MKNVRVKVRICMLGGFYDFGIFEGRKVLMVNPKDVWRRKEAVIRNAKAMAKRIGIKYDPEIIKVHGC